MATQKTRQVIGVRRFASLLNNQRCTLCGKQLEYCRCTCTWCKGPMYEHVKGGGYIRHMCPVKHRRVEGARKVESGAGQVEAPRMLERIPVMKTKMEYVEALELAYRLRADLARFCERVVIAGSLRRRCAQIGDIELVAIPKMEVATDLFGRVTERRALLDEYLARRYEVVKGGEKYKQIRLPGSEMVCDLFLQPDPATWGVNLAIRTGSADFARWLVTDRLHGGGKPNHLAIRDARVWDGSVALETPEEEDFFEVLGVRWIEPEERVSGLWGKEREKVLNKENLTLPTGVQRARPGPFPKGKGRLPL